MNALVLTYLAYLLIAVPITLWVGSTLRRNGQVFLLDVFAGDEELARAVNHLLVVGFYLVNLGFVSIALKTSDAVIGAQTAIETLSIKVGTVVLVLGVMHFANLYVLNKLRRRAQLNSSAQLTSSVPAPPPAAPGAAWSSGFTPA